MRLVESSQPGEEAGECVDCLYAKERVDIADPGEGADTDGEGLVHDGGAIEFPRNSPDMYSFDCNNGNAFE